MPFDAGQKFRFEKDGCKPRTFVLLDVQAMSPEERSQHAASSSKGDVVFLRNAKPKKGSNGIAAIMVDWLEGRGNHPGRWVPVK